MSLNVNKAILAGRLVVDPELKKSTSSGISVTSFRIAVDRKFSGKDTKKKTDFLNIVAWRERAEFICNYFHKGMPIYIEGSIQNREWKDKNGNNRLSTDIVVELADFIESKSNNNASQSNFSQSVQSFAEIDTADDDYPF